MMGGQKVAPTPQPPVASTAMAPSVVPFQGRAKPEDAASHITVSLILFCCFDAAVAMGIVIINSGVCSAVVLTF
jgi:hypothetical protein